MGATPQQPWYHLSECVTLSKVKNVAANVVEKIKSRGEMPGLLSSVSDTDWVEEYLDWRVAVFGQVMSESLR